MDELKIITEIRKIIEEVKSFSVPGDNWSFCTNKEENFAAYNTMWDRLDSSIDKLEAFYKNRK